MEGYEAECKTSGRAKAGRLDGAEYASALGPWLDQFQAREARELHTGTRKVPKLEESKPRFSNKLYSVGTWLTSWQRITATHIGI